MGRHQIVLFATILTQHYPSRMEELSRGLLRHSDQLSRSGSVGALLGARIHRLPAEPHILCWYASVGVDKR